uniref:Uncharacterized protein n=1 Tax=Vespula pensylvanica TaxID=30213 RepID=A0A834JNT1_VESPE|nr:hypothetical protein H0235_017684 [Vespula pensylvanica]
MADDEKGSGGGGGSSAFVRAIADADDGIGVGDVSGVGVDGVGCVVVVVLAVASNGSLISYTEKFSESTREIPRNPSYPARIRCTSRNRGFRYFREEEAGWIEIGVKEWQGRW